MSFTQPIVAGTELVRQAIKSPNYLSGISGWTINQDGSAEFAGTMIIPQLQIGANPTISRTIYINGIPGECQLKWIYGAVTSQFKIQPILDADIGFECPAGPYLWLIHGSKKVLIYGDLEIATFGGAVGQISAPGWIQTDTVSNVNSSGWTTVAFASAFDVPPKVIVTPEVSSAAASISLVSSGLIERDNFTSDTSANYDCRLGTLTIAGSVCTINSSTDTVEHNGSKTARCVTVQTRRVSSKNSGAWLGNVYPMSADADVDGYALYMTSGAWALRRMDNGVLTSLADTGGDIPAADGDWTYARLVKTSTHIYGYAGATTLNAKGAVADASYGPDLYGGFRSPAMASGVVDKYDSRTSHQVYMTGLPAGYYAEIDDGVNTAKAVAVAGTATIDGSQVFFPFVDINVYDADPAAGGVLMATLASGGNNNYGGGSTFNFTPGGVTGAIDLRVANITVNGFDVRSLNASDVDVHYIALRS